MTVPRTHLAAIFAASLLLPTLQAQDTPYQQLPTPPQQRTQPPAPIVRPRPATSSNPDQSDTNPALPRRIQLPASPASSAVPASAKPKPAPVHHHTYSTITGPGTPGTALQQAPPGPFNRTVVFLDAAHGAADTGARINDSIAEKDVTLQFAFKLRLLLAARGFTVVLSRETDAATVPDSPDTQLTLDARAGMANHARPVACLLLHATGSGRGVHLYSSELTPANGELAAAPWLTAQAPWVAQSLKLEKQLGQAVTRAQIPLVLSRASIRPVDSLTCPALVIELAPKGNDSSSITDEEYQQRVAQAIASALVFWQNAAQPPPRLIAPPPVQPAPDALSGASPAVTGAEP